MLPWINGTPDEFVPPLGVNLSGPGRVVAFTLARDPTERDRERRSAAGHQGSHYNLNAATANVPRIADDFWQRSKSTKAGLRDGLP